jgi:condensin complex subunit 1
LLLYFYAQLLSSLLENNPYMGSLDPEPYRRKLNELYDEIIEKMPEHIKEAQEASRKEAQEANDEDALQALEQAALATIMEEVEDWQRHHADELTPEQQDYRSKVQALSFTQSTLDFIETFEEATCNLEGMLLSANTSDVTAALRLFVQASHFQLPCAVTGMKRALALMWSSEQAIRDEVLKAFADVFLEKPGPEGNQRLSDKQIANNLLVLTGQASVSEMASIEEAITRLVKDDRIPVNVFLFLWSIASKGSGNARVAALQLLSMGAGADRTIVDSKSRLKALLEAGFGEHARDSKDWRLVAAAATALQRIERAKVDVTDAKFLVLERIMDELCSVARGEWCQDDVENDTLQWFSAAEQVIKAIFVISPQPETACAEIIRGMHVTTFVEGESQCHSLRLARFFHVLGQIAMNLLVYTEALASSVRHANAKKTLKKQEEADRAKTQNRAFGAQQESDEEEEDAIEAELGMAAEVEAENERKLAEISEEEILGRGLINLFVPLLVRVVGNEGGRFTSEILMQAAMLALCKFMCVSSSFCEKHLPLLFTALGNAPSKDITMRANTIIALGDLAFRFPNEVEPYTPRIYACLRDPSTKVRRHTMMVLTHLILNDMVKVKGNVCEIAVCLRDDDHRIRDMSRLLFHELSKRSNNPVYNLLPDIVSQLSQLDGYKEEFRGIMSFLLGYIKKDRQNESLTEKFVQRFAKCTTVSQKADLAYCLALLKLNERSIKYLSDNFKLYKDALFDDDVKKSFSSIVFKAKKSAKPEMKQFLEEWEAKLQEMAEVSAENQQAGKKAAKARARASRKVDRKKQKQLTAIDEDEDDEDNGDDCAAKEEGADEVEEEEQEDDDFDFGKENTPKKESRKTKSTRKQSSRRGRRAAATLS